MTSRKWLGLFGVVAVSVAVAQPTVHQRRIDAEELFKLSGLEQMLNNAKADCIAVTTTNWNSPIGTAKRGETFRGRSPASPDWDKVLKLYQQYAERTCDYPKSSETKASYVEFYARVLSDAARAKYKQFLSSPEGQEVVSAYISHARQTTRDLAHQQAAFSAGAYEKFLEDLENATKK